jgi:hypothetical protein
MKNLSKKITSALIALTLMTGAVAYPKNEAKAAVVVNFAVPGVGIALVSLGVFMFGATFGIALDIHPAILGVACLLDKDMDQNALDKIKTLLIKEYGMQDNLISVIQDYLKVNAATAVTNADGSQSIVLNESQLSDVMNKAADAGIEGVKAESLKKLLSHLPTQEEINQMRAEIEKASK